MKEIQLNDEEKEAIKNLIENNLNLNQIIKKIEQLYSIKLNYEFVKKFAKLHCNKEYLKLEKQWNDLSDKPEDNIEDPNIVDTKNSDPDENLTEEPIPNLHSDSCHLNLFADFKILSDKLCGMEEKLNRISRLIEQHPEFPYQQDLDSLDIITGKARSVSISVHLRDLVVEYVESKFPEFKKNTSKCIQIALIEALYHGITSKERK